MKIPGKWRQGYVLDYHTLRSEFLGHDGFGHPMFATERSEVGELLYKLKYRSDKLVVDTIVGTVVDFVSSWNLTLDFILPTPPSKQRVFQPVLEIAKGLSNQLSIALCADCIVKAKNTPELKNVYDFDQRMKLLENAYNVNASKVRGQNILLFDDLYRSGATLNAITEALYTSGEAANVYALALTKTKEHMMTKVFIGGSRKLTKLPTEVKSRIDNIIQNDFTVIVGDANGADKGVQTYLADKGYEKVVVFCMAGICRNNIGEWKAEHISVDSHVKGFRFYAAKDSAMAKEANYGFMIWDAKSSGTLNNIINLLGNNKKVLVYFSPDKQFYNLTSSYDLPNLLKKCDNEILDNLQKKLGLIHFPREEQSAMEFA